MSTAPASVARNHRRRTAVLLVAALAALAAVVFLSPRRTRVRTAAGPTSPYLSARLDSSHILRGTTETYLAVALAAPDNRITSRAPTSVAIVLDRSGSMLGQPWTDAVASAKVLIDKLGPDDELAIVAYSTNADIVLPLGPASGETRAKAKAAIDTLAADGGTNISGGLNLGADELARARTPLRRMVLISDGQANEGIYDRGGLVRLASARAASGISITSVGVGLDFNEDTMAGIAVAGRGNYHFVENAADLGAMFVAELGSLGETVLTHAALRIEPAAGVEILDVIGYELTREGGAVIIPVADLRRGEHTKVVLRIRATVGGESVKELAHVTWTFDELGKGSRTETALARAEVTGDATIVASTRDKDTVRLVEEARTARALEEASAAYTDGKLDQAQQILRIRAAEAQALAGEMDDDTLGRDIGDITGRVERGFAAAPSPGAAEGRKATKGGRADAYSLAR
ncbi:MAG TPA: VWA domain-containing protein [Kofleriaceae bacterium]|nr:VWA domain-containing protein [Kofleriaceae bacterium]